MSDKELTFEDLKNAVKSNAAAFRCVTKLQPAGSPGDKVFPPTYEGGKYATEERIIDGKPIKCVILDAVQSQANRMEMALLDCVQAKQLELPLVEAVFNHESLIIKFTVTSLDAPHRVADAIFRDSLYNGVIFRSSEKGKILDNANIKNATGLFSLCPTALLFGIWDSAGPRRGLGAKFQRAITSEIIGVNAVAGISTGGKVDTIPITSSAGPLYERTEKSNSTPDWTLDESLGGDKIGNKKNGKPSDANLGGIPPDFSYARNKNGSIIYDNGIPRIKGGYTFDYARLTTVLSLTALRRYKFPKNGKLESDPENDTIARMTLAALGIAGAVLMVESGLDLRSRCQLYPIEKSIWELLGTPGEPPREFYISSACALKILKKTIDEAKKIFPWEGKITLTPTDELIKLVSTSQKSGSSPESEEEE